MRHVRGLVSGSLAVTSALLQGGCAAMANRREAAAPYVYPHYSAPTLTQTPEEHERTVRAVVHRDAQGLMDDLDVLFMTDRPSRLNRWQDR